MRKRNLYSLFPIVSEKLLRMKDSHEAINQVLEALGNATNSDRVYYFSNDYENDVYGCRYQNEWCKEGISKEINNPLIAFIPWEDIQIVYDEFKQQQSLTYHVDQLTEKHLVFKPYLVSQGIISLHLVKVFYENRFLGFVGFDSCKEKRVWDVEEVQLLEYLADILAHRLIRDDATLNMNRLLNNSNRRNQFLVAIRELSKNGNSADPSMIFHLLTDSVSNLLEVSHVGLCMRMGSELVPVSPFSKNEGLNKWLNNYVRNNSLEDNVFLDSETWNKSDDIYDQNIKKILIIPLNGADYTLGALFLSNVDEQIFNEKITDFDIAIDVLKSVIITIFQENEKKVIQRKVEDQKAAFESVLETVLSGYWYWDIPFKHELISQGLHKALGYDFKTNPITTLEQVIHKDDRDFFYQHIKAKDWMKTRSTHLEQFRFIHITGKERIMRMGVTVVDRTVQGDPLKIMACIIDVTNDAKLAEKLSLNLAREKELSKMKSHFVSLVSHQFRTPMSIIQANLELIDTYRKTRKTDKISGSIQRIELEIDRLNNLISKVLTMESVAETDYLNVKTPIVLVPFFEKLISRFNKVNGKTIRLETSIDEDQSVYLSLVKFENILDNLISNAIKYVNDKEIIVRLVKKDSRSVSIEVVDFGIGIPKDQVKDVFLPFHRASNAENISGTGLGLSIVKEFCDDLKIDISVESKEGYACFRLTIPLLKQKKVKIE